MSRKELIRAADRYRKQGLEATGAMRLVYFRKARNYYADAGMGAWVQWLEARMA